MANVEKISVALTPEMAADMRKAVESGEYASSSEVVRDAMREWKHRRKQRDEAIDELKKLLSEGRNSGPLVDGDLVFDELLHELDAMDVQ
jgi:antitoxin ParD1/3/4